MSKPVLRVSDGFRSGRPELKKDVQELQKLLGIPADGLFGQSTEVAVKKYQKENGLDDDGVVGPATWKSLLRVHEADSLEVGDGFRGDLQWVHAREGHAGRAYWPGGVSGVTLDPGFDLGHVSPELFEEAYEDVLTAAERAACRAVLGIKGAAAKEALENASAVLKGIRLSREEADKVFPFVATPYWRGIVKRYPVLAEEDCPSSVQTALLSIAFNRGYNNSKLEVLDAGMQTRDWEFVAITIGRMQQNHELKGIRKRRRMESNLIREELGMAVLDLSDLG